MFLDYIKKINEEFIKKRNESHKGYKVYEVIENNTIVKHYKFENKNKEK